MNRLKMKRDFTILSKIILIIFSLITFAAWLNFYLKASPIQNMVSESGFQTRLFEFVSFGKPAFF